MYLRVEKKEEVKKTYDWKKGVKKVEKKEPEEPKPQEKVQLKKPKTIEKPKEVPQEGIKLKPIPAKEKKEEEKQEGVKLKPVPPKEKKVSLEPDNMYIYTSRFFQTVVIIVKTENKLHTQQQILLFVQFSKPLHILLCFINMLLHLGNH